MTDTVMLSTTKMQAIISAMQSGKNVVLVQSEFDGTSFCVEFVGESYKDAVREEAMDVYSEMYEDEEELEQAVDTFMENYTTLVEFHN